MYLKEKQKQNHIQTEKSKHNSSETCDVCQGSGSQGDGVCSSCNGKGMI